MTDQTEEVITAKKMPPKFRAGQFEKKCDKDQIIAAFVALPTDLSITERAVRLSNQFGVHLVTVRRHLVTARLIGDKAKKGGVRVPKLARAQHVATQAAAQVIRAIAPLFESAEEIGAGLAAGLVLSSVINTQRERVRDLSKLVKRLSVQVEHVIGPHLDAVTGAPLPVDPASVHASTRTFASLVAAVSELNAEERRAWGIKEEAGLLSWSETLDQLDRAQVVNGQLVSPGSPAAAMPDDPQAQTPSTSAGATLEGESRVVAESEKLEVGKA